jgi:O-methyltransferase
MNKTLRTILSPARSVIRAIGLDVIKYPPLQLLPPDLDDWERKILSFCRPRTLTTYDRLAASIQAIKHVEKKGIEGAVVECGVWRGGNMMAMAMALLHLGNERDLYLYDTFEGMSPPTEHDVDYLGVPAEISLSNTPKGEGVWCEASLKDVQSGMESTGYPASRTTYVVGKVEETLAKQRPEKIAVLRLDTDWYESTAAELEALYPLLEPGGVIMIDDYGHWQGSRKACDEYFAKHGIYLFLNRVDFGCRVAVKA